MTAQRLVQRMKKDSIHSGRRPSGLCGAGEWNCTGGISDYLTIKNIFHPRYSSFAGGSDARLQSNAPRYHSDRQDTRDDLAEAFAGVRRHAKQCADDRGVHDGGPGGGTGPAGV